MKCISLFKCNPQIEVIDKSHCSLEDVPNLQSYSRSLEELFLDANKLTVLNDNLFRLTKLRRFSFSDNAVQDIPSNISKLVNLVELDCSRNKILAIPDQIKFLRGLRYCDFSANNIEVLPQGFVNLKNLTILTLNYCPIRCLPDDFGMLKNLESLELRENELEYLPESITELESLRKLDLGRNLLKKLPEDIGSLSNLEYLLVDGNHLETVPASIGQLENLQCLDLALQECGLKHLPEEISGLRSLTDLHLSENSLQNLPDGIKNLKSLLIFKVDNNFLSDLNSNIGGCTSLQELVLTSNRLTELPASISNLLDLRTLNVDSNMLTDLVPRIGYLKKLCIMSLRDNFLSHLPNEIGHLESISVMDISGNRLEYLPITMTALNLKALWLSKNQAQPLPKLQIDELHNGTKVLTCYLLPQQPDDDLLQPPQFPSDFETQDTNRQAAVSFDDAAVVDDDLDDDAQFVRHNTPHPKELRARHQNLFNKNEMKGHDNASFNSADPKKNDFVGNQTTEFNIVPANFESNGLPEAPVRTFSQTKSILKNSGLVVEEGRNYDRNLPDDDYEYEANDNDHVKNNYDDQNCYPEHTKSLYKVKEIFEERSTPLGTSIDKKSETFVYEQQGLDPNRCYVMDIVVKKRSGYKPGLGLSIAGGKDTPPFIDGDEGIFVSKVTPNGSSEAAGVKVGDKILAVNDFTFPVGITHHKAVEIFRKIKPDSTEFTLKILRDPLFVVSDDEEIETKPAETNGLSKQANDKSQDSSSEAPAFIRTYSMPIQSNGNSSNTFNMRQSLKADGYKPKSSASTLSTGMSLLENSINKNIVYTTLVKDYKRDLGLILENKPDEAEMRSNWSNIVIIGIKPDSIAAADGKLRVDDRILSINGSDVSSVDLNRVKDLLENTDRFIRIVVSRGENDDHIGNTLKNMPARPPLGSYFASSANMTQRPSLTGSYRRPTFGSVNSLQGNNAFDPNKQMASSSVAIPGLVPVQAHVRSNSSHTRLVGLRSQDSTTETAELIDVTKKEEEKVSQSSQMIDFEQRAAWRQERLKSLEEDLELARRIGEARRKSREGN